MTTAREIVTAALKDSGAVGLGQTANAEDENDAFTRLNWMIGQWRVKRWLVYNLVTVSFTSTGAVSYTVAAAGNFVVTARPDKLESAFIRQIVNAAPNQVDFPLTILQAREDYDRIAVKQLAGLPQCVFYDSAYPTGVVYFWPVPQASTYSLHLTLKTVLTQFTNLSDTVTLPEEYKAALHFNLALRLCPSYQITPNPALVTMAEDSLNTIRGANTQIARLHMPAGLVGRGRYVDYYTDQ